MKIHTSGNINGKKILFLHPMYASGKIMNQLFVGLEKDFFLIWPDFSRHGEEGDTEYISMKEEIDNLIASLKDGGLMEIDAIYGASMGASAVLELLKRGELFPKIIYLDGAPVYRNHVLGKKFYSFCSYIRRAFSPVIYFAMEKRFGKEIGKSMAKTCFAIPTGELVRMINDCYTFDFPDYPENQRKRMHFDYGEKEISKGCAATVRKYYPEASICFRKGEKHCGRLVGNSISIVDDITQALK